MNFVLRSTALAVCLGFFGADVLLAEDAHAGDTTSLENTGVGSVGGGAYGGTERSIGFADGMIRVGGPFGGILLLNPRFSLWDDDEDEISLAVIFRRLSEGGGRFTMYGRGEYRDTAEGNDFSTWSGGLEQRAPWYMYRVRGYLSPHGSELLEQFVVEEIVPTPGGGTETTRRTFDVFEVPLSGWEVEVGPRIPIPEFLGELRALLGWHYEDGPGIDEEEGWMTRVEYRPIERLILEMLAYFDGDFDDSEIFWGGRFTFPFGPDNSAPGADFWFEPLPITPRQRTVVTMPTENESLRTVEIMEPPKKKSDDEDEEEVEEDEGGGEPIMDPEDEGQFDPELQG